jgi:membrane protein DedA with SNARE-associated domain
MTVLAAIAALALATCVGYYLGRRASATPSSWKKRTSRIALGRLALSMVVLVTARRIRQRLPAPYLLAPLGLLRAGAARMRAY